MAAEVSRDRKPARLKCVSFMVTYVGQ
jgi:hypothetical protein